MTDFTRFLNSEDIAEHLRKINYEFSPEEAAFVVHEARNVPLSIKHEAYRELIARYPDFILEKRNGDFETQPLSEFLQELMRLETEYIAECKTPSPNAAYTCLVYTEDQSGRLFWFEGDAREILYPTYEACFRAASEEEAVKLRVKKRYFGGRESVELELLPDGEVLSVTVSGKDEGITTAFDWFWIKLPTPFRRGDLLRCISEMPPRDDELLVVLETMSTWGGKELKENGFRDCGNKPNMERKRGELDFAAWDRLIEYHKKEGDIGDMNLEGYEIKSNGEILWDTYATYLDFERCRNVPENKKALVALSAYMKGEISEDLLLNAYRYHVLKSVLAETKDAFSLYTEEGLARAGISPEQNRTVQNSEGEKDET